MGVEIGIVGAAIVAAGAVWLTVLGRNRRRERIEVENMFSPDANDRDWWEERR